MERRKKVVKAGVLLLAGGEGKKPRILKDICELTRKKDMPMESYLWVHSEARVTDADIAALCAWSDAARRQLQAR